MLDVKSYMLSCTASYRFSDISECHNTHLCLTSLLVCGALQKPKKKEKKYVFEIQISWWILHSWLLESLYVLDVISHQMLDGMSFKLMNVLLFV